MKINGNLQIGEMKMRKILFSAGFATLMLTPTFVFAQRTIKCESRQSDYNYCPTHTTGRVELSEQLSKASCTEYQTWGADGDGSGIWVREGCRAVFTVAHKRRGTSSEGQSDPGQIANRACEEAVTKEVRGHFPQAERVQFLADELRIEQESNAETKVRGGGQFDSSDGWTKFSFKCMYNIRSGDTYEIRVRER
jgi:hypothetical protein